MSRPNGLTDREWEIARRVCLGERTKTVAADLHVSPRTIESHLASVYRKLGVSSRRELGTLLSAQDTSDVTAPPPCPPVHFAKSRDRSIAYQVFGDGDVDIAMVPGLASHLEVLWENPGWRSFVAQVSALGRLIVFDKRGTGLSDPVDRHFGVSPDQRMIDGLAVLDAVGSERVIALGLSEAAPMCLYGAVTRPERITGVVIYGAAMVAGAQARERRRRLVSLAEASYGTGLLAGRLWPSLTGTEEGRFWLARYERHAATSGMVARLMAMNNTMNVAELVGTVRQPVAVVLNVDDPVVPFVEAERLVKALPRARLFRTHGQDHMPWGAVELKPLLDGLRWTIAQTQGSLTTS